MPTPASLLVGSGLPVMKRLPRAVTLGHLSRSVGTVFMGNVVARGLGFLFPLVVAHNLNVQDFATTYFLINSGFFVAELVTASYPTAMIRRVAAEDVSSRGTWILGAGLGGIPMLALAVATGAVVASVGSAPPLLMSMVLLGLSIDIYFFGVLSGLQRFGLLAAYRVAANLTQILLLVGLLALGVRSLTVVIAVYSFVYVLPIMAIEALYAPLRTTLRGARKPTRSEIAQLTRFAIPSLAAGLAYGGVLGLDVMMVRLLDPAALPAYSAARTLALPMMLVPLAIGVVVLPSAAARAPAEQTRLLLRALLATAVLSVAAVGAYLTLGSRLVDALFPSSFQDAIDPLRALSPALGLFGIYTVLSQWSLGVGRPVAPAVSLSCGASCGLVAHLLLTGRHGAVGAALALGIGAAVALLLLGAATLTTNARRAVRTERAGL